MRAILLLIFLLLFGIFTVNAQSPLWAEKDDYVNGFARVFAQGKFTFVDKDNNQLSPLIFEDARNFHRQLAAVRVKDKWGFINEKGNIIIPTEYDIVFDFTYDLTVVSKQAQWWLIDRQGVLIKSLDISNCYGFKDSMAVVYKDKNKGRLFLDGRIVLDPPAIEAPVQKIPYSPPAVASVCPVNLNFESGNFTNWTCYLGHVDSVGNTNVITVTPSPPTAGRHTLYARATPSLLDAYGLFPINPPDGSAYAVKLGNTQVNAEAERIRYVIHVPLNDSNFSFRYNYAVVLQDPGHTPWTQPRFTAKLFDSTANTYINCASFEYISTSGLPGFIVSPVNSTVIYKSWSQVFISLRGYGGKTLYLDFTTADCVRKAHWGYAYVDVENTCGQSVQAQYNCDTPHITTLTGPPGFQFYKWWNQTFTTVLGTGQTVTLNPGPPPNSLLWCEMTPFANFGCRDTLPVRLSGIINASFNASDTFGICAPHSFTFYNHSTPSGSATWNFGDGTTGSGDTVTHVFNLPGTYIVRLNVTGAGACTGSATDTVRIIQPTASYSYTGGSFCNSKTVQFTATTAFIDSLSWDFGDGTLLTTTLATVSHTYNQPGTYIPRLVAKSIHGCQLVLPGPDTIRIEKITAGFLHNFLYSCLSTTLSFTDTSHAYFGLAAHNWSFGDGGSASGTTVNHTYSIAGTYNVKLVVTGIFGCKDSVVKSIVVQVHNVPVSSITGPAAACANTTLIFTGSVVSADAVNSMSWWSSNGATGTGSSFSAAFNLPGTYTVRLISSTIYNCSDTVTHVVIISPVPTATVGNPATVCLDAASPVVTFTGAGGTAPYTFIYKINGGPNQTVTTTSGNSVIVPVPTNIAGTFTYTLISVQDGSSTSCSQAQSGSVAIVVQPLPTATISGPETVCLNAVSPVITFTGSGSTPPYIFTYSVNGGANQTVTASSGNVATISAPTGVAGTFNYNLVNVSGGSSLNCSQAQSGSVAIVVQPLPTASISGSATLCLNAVSPVITFTGAGGSSPYTFTYSINGTASQTISSGSGNTATITVPTNTAGTFNYSLVNVSEGSSLNCSQAQSGSAAIVVRPLPTASISGSATVCLNGASPVITFTGAGGSPPYTFTYSINGAASQTISSGSGNTATITVPTNTAGTFNYTLVSVSEGSSLNCNEAQSGSVAVVVRPLPTATISGQATVCLNAVSPMITFTGAGGSPPYTFTYSINGAASQTISSGSGNTATIVVPTNVAGTFNYSLINVSEGSSLNCSQAQSGTVAVIVQPLPTASISGTATVCLNAISPVITFTGAGGSPPYTFTYSVNGAGSQTISSGSGNTATITVPTNTAGTFNYSLVNVSEGSSLNCSQAQSGSVAIVVQPLPTATISGPATVCLNAASPLITFTGAGGSPPYTFTYSVNGAASQTISSGSGNTATITVPTNTAGTFSYTLISVSEGSSLSCSQAQSGSAAIVVQPLPTATISGPATVCLNAASPVITFTGAGSTPPYIFTYSVNGGPNQTVTAGSGNATTISVPTGVAGTFNYTLVGVQGGTSSTCSQAQSGTVPIVVRPLPTATISSPATVCLNAASPVITFTGAGGSSPYTFTYSVNGAASQTISSGSGNTATITIPTNIAGTFNYTLVSVSEGSSLSCSQAQPGSASIVIAPLPIVNAGIDRDLCLGSAVSLNATGAAQYLWSPSTGLSCNNCPNPLASPTNNTRYIVRGTSSFGCVSTDTINVNVIRPFLMTASPNDTICVGGSAKLVANGAVIYSWSPSTRLNRTDIASPIASPLSTTTYRVIGTGAQNCFRDTAFITIYVGQLPTVNAGGDLHLATGDVVTLKPVVQNGPIIRWLWEPATDLSCTNCPNPRLAVHNDITYTVSVTNQYHCVSKDVINIFTFCKSAQVFIPNAFTPDGDGWNDVLMIRGKGIHVNFFRIFNRWGELIFEKKNFEPNDPANGWDGRIRGIPASPDVFVYTAEITCDNNVKYTLKGNTTLLK